MKYNIILENALQSIIKKNLGNKNTIEQDLFNYRRTYEYLNLELLEKAFLIVELDKLKSIDLSELYIGYITDNELHFIFDKLIKKIPT